MLLKRLCVCVCVCSGQMSELGEAGVYHPCRRKNVWKDLRRYSTMLTVTKGSTSDKRGGRAFQRAGCHFITAKFPLQYQSQSTFDMSDV